MRTETGQAESPFGINPQRYEAARFNPPGPFPSSEGPAEFPQGNI
jgi:hypothetical protein